MSLKKGARRLLLVLTCALVLVFTPFLSGCGSTQPERQSPIKDLTWDEQRGHLYMGSTPYKTNPVNGGGLVTYDADTKSISYINRSTGLPNGNFVSTVKYDPLSGKLFFISAVKGPYGQLLQVYDPDSGCFTSKGDASFTAIHPAGDRWYYSNSQAEVYNASMSNSSSTRITGFTFQSTDSVTALFMSQGLLYVGMSTGQFYVCRNNAAVKTEWSGSGINRFAAGPPAGTVYFTTSAGLGYYDPPIGKTFVSSCKDNIIDITADSTYVYLLVNTGSKYVVKSYLPSSDTLTTLFDSGKCSAIDGKAYCIECAPSRGLLFVGGTGGLGIYDLATKKITVKTYKNGLPSDPPYFQGPGFELVPLIAAVAGLLLFRRYKQDRLKR